MLLWNFLIYIVVGLAVLGVFKFILKRNLFIPSVVVAILFSLVFGVQLSKKMSVVYVEYTPIMSEEKLSNTLKSMAQKEQFEMFYTNQQSSKNIDLKDSAKATLVFLRGGDYQTYSFSNVKKAKTQAIIYTGMSTKIVSDSDVKLLHVSSLPKIAQLYPATDKCENQGEKGIVCPNFNDLFALNNFTMEIAGGKISGFTPSQETNLTTLILPLQKLDIAEYEKIDLFLNKIALQKEDMQKRVENPFYMYADKRWFDILHVSKNDVPSNSFNAYYMSKFSTPNVKFSEIVQQPEIEYSQKHYGINANNFVGYWVGDFQFVRPVAYKFDMSFKDANVKVLIDQKVVYSGSTAASFVYKFNPAKKYRIEIEYINKFNKVALHVEMKRANNPLILTAQN